MSTKNIYISTHPPTVPRYPLSSMKSLGSTGVVSHSRDWALGYQMKVLIIILLSLHPPKLYTAHLARLVGQVHRQPVPNRASPPPPRAMWPRVMRRVWTK